MSSALLQAGMTAPVSIATGSEGDLEVSMCRALVGNLF